MEIDQKTLEEVRMVWQKVSGIVVPMYAGRDALHAAITAYYRAREEQGFVEVPVEPTPEMLDVGQHVNSEWLNDSAPLGERIYRAPAEAVYKRMVLTARPQKEGE